MAIRSRYQYSAEMSYISSDSNKEYIILGASIEYIMASYDYEKAMMPVLCMKVKLDAAIYSKMVTDQDKGKVYLNLKKINVNGTSSVYKSYINDQFDYVMTDNPNTTSQMDGLVTGQGQSYHQCIIGLIKKQLIQNNQKQFNGIFKNTTMSSLVLDATSHMKILIEPFKYNTPIETLNVPATPSVMKYLAYLNSRYNFYGDQYMFFMDFDMAYLKSNSGKYIDSKDGQHPYIAIDIRDMTDYKSNTTGIVIDDKQKAYIIYIDSSEAKIYPDRVTPQVAGNIANIDKEIQSSTVKINTSDIVNTQSDSNSVMYVDSSDPNYAEYVANTLQNNAVTIVFNKTEMDCSIFTPNKEYLVSNYVNNSQYTGRYYLSFKKELFQNNGLNFTCASNIGLKMVVHY